MFDRIWKVYFNKYYSLLLFFIFLFRIWDEIKKNNNYALDTMKDK